MQQLLLNKLPEAKIFFKKHEIRKAYLFGSALTEKFNSNSDIDFLVDVNENIDPVILGEHLWNLETDLENLFGREIDLITSRAQKNSYFIQEVRKKMLPVYEQ